MFVHDAVSASNHSVSSFYPFLIVKSVAGNGIILFAVTLYWVALPPSVAGIKSSSVNSMSFSSVGTFIIRVSKYYC